MRILQTQLLIKKLKLCENSPFQKEGKVHLMNKDIK